VRESVEQGEPGHVIVVDDEPAMRRGLARDITSFGHTVETFADGADAAQRISRGGIDVVISDISMPGLDGIELLRRVRSDDLDLPVVLVTGAPKVSTAIAAVEHGALRYLTKPVDRQQLRDTVAQAVQLHRLARVRRQLLDLGGEAARQIGDRVGLEVRFQRALVELYLHYQPIVCWSDRTVFGYEALVRSREPSLPHPGALLDAAERLDQMHQLGRRIRALAPIPMGNAPSAALLFVNLHSSDLLDDELFGARSPLAEVADRVILELTERAALDRIPDVKGKVRRLREIGFRIALDDIGAGYAGLNSFALLDPDVVKLDMALVRGLDLEPTKQRLVRSLLDLSRELGMLVVAEGVETYAERDILLQLGCNLLQGYLFAKPAEPFVTPNWL
jgi:EAL domain-containing protein (putative c-di-GMP-specific phosphodiesterase class I)